MSKGIFAYFILGLVTLIGLATPASSHAVARGLSPSSDGCSSLARIVEQSVLRSAVDVRLINASVRITAAAVAQKADGSATVDEYCGALVSSTSEAFAAALSRIGLTVRWAQPTAVSGDYCLSHYLSQCYPRVDFSAGANTAAQLSFVADIWKAVRVSVSQLTADGTGPDFATFNADHLERSLLQSTERYVSTSSGWPQLPARQGPADSNLRR